MKPEFMRLRRAFAGTLAALLMAVGIVVLSPALSASAHHNTIDVSASCVNHAWTITWTITNSESDKSEQVTSSSDQAIIADGTTIAAGGTYTMTETVTGPVDKTLTVTAKWSNDAKNTSSNSITKAEFRGSCAQPDNPKLSANTDGCVAYGTTTGKVSFSLSGVNGSYLIELRQNGTVVQSTSSTSGSGQFINVAAGTYTVKAWTQYKKVETPPFTVVECAPNTPVIAIVVGPCVTGGSLGAITTHLSNLNTGVSYSVVLHSADGKMLQTKDVQAASATVTTSFAKRGPGSYYVTVAIGSGPILVSSAHAAIKECTPVLNPKLVTNVEPCVSPSTRISDRKISVTVSDLAPSTVYTVQLVTADAAATEIASTTTPGESALTFTHTFAGLATGDYKVQVLGGTDTLTSNTVTAVGCGLDTLAPPSVELIADQCDGSGTGIDALTARLIDLDATQTYFVRIVDEAGATVPGGEDRTISGSTTATVEFPDVTAAGTYAAQLLVNPGMQLAATSPATVDFAICLPTLAMTGPGVLVPLGSVAALLLTLGGAVVTGRLRRRMALS